MRFEDNEYYHVYNRGAHKAPIFFTPEHYHHLISLLIKNSPRYKIRVSAYCLMPNHYHFVLKQDDGGSISKFLQTVFNSYVQGVNLQSRHSGTLFEAKSKAKHIDSDDYALQVIRYIHANPVKAGLTSTPEAWEFSDFSAWCDLRESNLTDFTLRDAHFKNGNGYRMFVEAMIVHNLSEDRKMAAETLGRDMSDLPKNAFGKSKSFERFSPSRNSSYNPSEGQSDSKENLRKGAGTLYLVSTPIGNLDDITYRAVKTLASVDLIAAEDTRKTKILLDHYQINKPMVSYYNYNERQRAPELIERLLQGQSVAVVSDAGTPGISDPAFYLVRAALAHSISVIPIPGAAAFISALIVSGLPTDSFVFEGFLPQKKGRKTKLESLCSETRTIILYESPHRILKTLGEISTYLGNRHVVVARELTKKFEEIVRGPVNSVLEELSKKTPRGEYVLIVEGMRDRGGADTFLNKSDPSL